MTQLAQRHSPAEMLSKVFEPALIEVGERWFRGVASIYQEHLATGTMLELSGWRAMSLGVDVPVAELRKAS